MRKLGQKGRRFREDERGTEVEELCGYQDSPFYLPAMLCVLKEYVAVIITYTAIQSEH